MAQSRLRPDPEPIAELFGDVVQERAPLLYGAPEDEAAADAPPHDDSEDAAEGQSFAGDLGVPMHVPERDGPPRYVNDRGLLSSVVALHGLITVLTLGLYRFWQKTAQRRIVWSHTRLDGEPLDYVGRGSEMFVGGMIAMVLVALTLIAANFATLHFGVASLDDPQDADVARLLVVSVATTLPLIQYAAYRARRYQLSRTVWRGLRFGMDGSGLAVVGLWLLWAPVIVCSLGLLYPFWRHARERYLTTHMHWGGERFGFAPRAFRLFAHWVPVWMLGMLALAFLVSPELRDALVEASKAELERRSPVAVFAFGVAVALMVALVWLNYRAAEIRLFWSARRLAGARASCDFSVWHMVDAIFTLIARNIWPGILVYLVIGAIAGIWFWGAMSTEIESAGAEPLIAGGAPGEMLDNLQSWRAQALALVGVLIVYVLSAVFTMWLAVAVYARQIHENICDSLRIYGLQRLDMVCARARQPDKSLQAEGFADAMDFGGF